MLYKNRQDYEIAEENYMIALEIFENNLGSSSHEVAAVYNNLGTLFYDSGFLSQSREMHEQALDILSQLKESSEPDLGQSHANLAASLGKIGEIDEALANYQLAVNFLENNLNNGSDIYEITCENYSNLLRQIGKKRKANSIQKKAKRLVTKFT